MGRTEPGPCYGPGCDHVSHVVTHWMKPGATQVPCRAWRNAVRWTEDPGAVTCKNCLALLRLAGSL